MKLPVSITRDEDGIFIASCLAIPGCVSQGNTEKEAEFNIASAIQQCLAARAEAGMTAARVIHEVVMREIEIPV